METHNGVDHYYSNNSNFSKRYINTTTSLINITQPLTANVKMYIVMCSQQQKYIKGKVKINCRILWFTPVKQGIKLSPSTFFLILHYKNVIQSLLRLGPGLLFSVWEKYEVHLFLIYSRHVRIHLATPRLPGALGACLPFVVWLTRLCRRQHFYLTVHAHQSGDRCQIDGSHSFSMEGRRFGCAVHDMARQLDGAVALCKFA